MTLLEDAQPYLVATTLVLTLVITYYLTAGSKSAFAASQAFYATNSGVNIGSNEIDGGIYGGSNFNEVEARKRSGFEAPAFWAKPLDDASLSNYVNYVESANGSSQLFGANQYEQMELSQYAEHVSNGIAPSHSEGFKQRAYVPTETNALVGM